jgi:hypothetical protein
MLPAFRNSIMKSLKFAAAALVCLSVIGSAAVSHADIVFGNLGASGTNALNPSTNASITDVNWLAHGFTVGGTNTVLSSVTLGLYDNSNTVARVQLFASGSGSVPSGLPLATLTQTVSSLTPARMTFSFSPSLSLTSGSSYWVVVSTTETSGLFNWSFNNEGDFPTAQNSSGYSALSPVTMASTDSGASWSTSGVNRPASISITAVPEPSSIVLAGLGVLAAGYQLRRRMKRA